jgi:serine/threonine protein phosphatase PrpC
MTRFETAQTTQTYRKQCEDRAHVIASDERTVIVVADGAGGSGGGATAAETVVSQVKAAYSGIENPGQWANLLKQIDFRIGEGESTAVVVDIGAESICGASVGDSQAWIVAGGQIVDLTSNQNRKPLLGSGSASPVEFTHRSLEGILVVATDGFCNYVKRDALTRLIAQSDFFEIPRRCVELVRLPSSELWDDIAIVVCRVRPAQRPRKRYDIGSAL